MLDLLAPYAVPVVVAFVLIILFAVLLVKSGIIVYIPNDAVGIVEKLWSLRGSVRNGFLALDGEAGFRPEVLRGGFALRVPFQYHIHRKSLVTVPQGTIGYLFARGGQPLPSGQSLAQWPEGADVEDARAFIEGGGLRGPQRRILREGVYAINLAQFVVFTAEGTHTINFADDRSLAGSLAAMHELISDRDGFRPMVLHDKSDVVGVVTVHDGPALDHGEIIAPTVGTDAAQPETFHNSYQNIEKFLAAGGRRGRQEQVLVEGTYYINRMFATVELCPKTVIPIGNAGVLLSYTGRHGTDVSGADYKHGELVEDGERGVRRQALGAGKYAINPYAIDVTIVPTTNFILRWMEGRSEDHGFDDNLSEIRLITKDAFEPILPMNIVVHIGYADAPWVIQQFADIRKLVEQTLDPMVSAWFKDAAQKYTLLELIGSRAELQQEALDAMKTRFGKYRLNVLEVMIGTPRAMHGDAHIDTVFDQLRVRQVSEERIKTYDSQQKAAQRERDLRNAEAAANAQGDLTRSAIQIEIEQNKGKAQLAIREQEARAIEVTAKANGARTRIEGEAEAFKVEAIGLANAQAAKAQVEAFGGPQAALTKEIAGLLSNAVINTKVPLVPNVQTGAGGGAPGTVVDALLGMLAAKSIATELGPERQS